MTDFADQFEQRSTRELTNILLTTRDEDEAESRYWNALSVLHRRGTADIFESAKTYCESDCSLEQRIGCDMLSQLGAPDRPFASISFPLVASVVRKTENLDTLACGLSALGWLWDPRAVDFVLPHLTHPDSDIRYWVTHALTALNEDERSINGLISLTNDPCNSVRDWATFGLGSQTELDTPAIRNALAARLNDNDIVVFGEALVGLAKRQDNRVIEPLLQALEGAIYKGEPVDYAVDALAELHDLEEYPRLLKWKTND